MEPDKSPRQAPDWVRKLFEQTLDIVAIPEDSAVLLEGSLAEGFGNAGSDVDFLVVVPGAEELPTLPAVLFVEGRRVEVRTRSVRQLREQLERLAAEPDEDLLNRCQRFLRAIEIRPGAVDLNELRALAPYSRFASLLAEWWTGRAVQALRYAVALRALGARVEAGGWARDGLQQAIKGWAAQRGETYLETKWLPHQLDRMPGNDLVDRYRELADPDTWLLEDPDRDFGDLPGVLGDGQARVLGEQVTWEQVWELTAALGLTGVTDDPHQVLLTRLPKVTNWTIGERIHVLREDRDVFVLSARAARAWRSVVFRRSIRDVLDSAPHDIRAELAEFVRLGLVGLQWRGAGVIEPVLAMCKPLRPLTPVPGGHTPALGLTGAARDDEIATLCPLPASRFTACGMNVVWSNIVLENAREDLAGAVTDGQGAVADIAAHRFIAMTVRILVSTYGIHPLPADVAPLDTVRRLLPPDTLRRADLLAALESAQRVRFSRIIREGTDPEAGLAVLDEFAGLVRWVAGGGAVSFPSSFDSREQWSRTLAISYEWLRLAAYLDTELPLDEARDLLTTGGQQPHLRSGGVA
ncbi:nucleotidyltransferase domain-containing protein [Nocardia sp. XZ_19_385]|uniref:nucleotidyltransferase domain-containing protein n=1 Tax=Nocardia sp. XZ_19_385 TaxID=2769488 RepID=UPI00188EA63D|nr:nucleotidyltransferase domain-containing protein [Nocardia sp. XZ_19_385]